MELVQELVHDGDGKFVLGHHGVKGAIVDAETPRAIGLAHQEDRRREPGCQDPDDALREHNRHLALELILL
jgi:hypothetical protein